MAQSVIMRNENGAYFCSIGTRPLYVPTDGARGMAVLNMTDEQTAVMVALCWWYIYELELVYIPEWFTGWPM